MKVQRICFALLCVVLFLSACNSGKEYPQLLVDADSAMVHGRYDEADSLLGRYMERPDVNQEDWMYYRLLQQGMRDKRGLELDNISLLDSLCYFYSKHSDKTKYGRTLLYLGSSCHSRNDDGQALNYYMQAEAEATKAHDNRLLCWIEIQKGDVYMDTHGYDDMIDSFRKAYSYSLSLKDTMQMSLSAARMGACYIHLNNADSAVYFFKKAHQLTENLPGMDEWKVYVDGMIADVYIQTERYDDARKYIDHSPEYYYCWGDLHQAENRLDSAEYYYEKRYATVSSAYAKLDVLDELIGLLKKRGDKEKLLKYYDEILQLKDSVNIMENIASLRRTEARYNYEQMKEERNQMARRNTVLTWIGFALLLLSLLCFAAYRRYERLQREKKEAELAAVLAEERMLRQDAQRASELNEQQAAANRERIRSLERQMELLRRQGEEADAQRLQVESRQLQAETQTLEAERMRRSEALAELERSPLLARMRANAGNDKFRMKEDDWEELRRLVDAADNNLTRRLLRLHPLRAEELRVCYLTKLGFAPADMALLLSKSQPAVSMMRRRMYQKLSGRKGSATDFEQLMAQL